VTLIQSDHNIIRATVKMKNHTILIEPLSPVFTTQYISDHFVYIVIRQECWSPFYPFVIKIYLFKLRLLKFLSFIKDRTYTISTFLDFFFFYVFIKKYPVAIQTNFFQTSTVIFYCKLLSRRCIVSIVLKIRIMHLNSNERCVGMKDNNL